MDWITEQIAIGNFIDARNASTPAIDAILCLKSACCDEDDEHLDIFCRPLIDGPGNDKRALQEAVDFIDEVVSRKERVLVHSHAGRSRSVCVVARYLMIKYQWTSHQALEKIQSKREIYLTPGLEEILDV